MKDKTKIWKIIRGITIGVLVLFFIRVIIDIINCMNMKYPHPMLGIDAYKWTDQFAVDMAFILYIFGIPLIINIVLLIVSCVKIKKLKG